MRITSKLALLAQTAVLAASVGGCAYLAVPPDPIRYVTSPAEVGACRKLGAVGLARTDGEGYPSFTLRTKIVRFDPEDVPDGPYDGGSPDGEIAGQTFAIRVETMRNRALGLGATDLLLSRRIYRDWSYVQGIAYFCRS